MQWPEHLVDDLARKRCVVFLGAGCSMSSMSEDGTRRPPGWVDFLDEGLRRIGNPKRHISGLIQKGDLLTACELIKSRLGEDWIRLVDDQFVVPRYKHSRMHEAVLKLDARVVLTQNFDKIYDTYAQTTTQNSIRVKSYTDPDVADFIRGGQSVILKAHGSIDVPVEMVFTRKEYSRARYSHQSFYMMMDALAVTHTFLFIGCGTSDPDVRLMLEKVAFFYGGSRPHYMCHPKSSAGPHPDVLSSIKDNLALKVLTYDPKDGHAALTTGIEELAVLVETRRQEMAGTLGW